MNPIVLSTPQVLRTGETEKLPVFGVEVEVLLDGAGSGGASAVYRVTAPPGAGSPAHRHEAQDEMFHVLEGEFDLRCGEAVHRLRPGDFAYVPRGAVHAFTSTGAVAGRLFVVSTPAGHEAFFRDCAAAVAAGTFGPETGAAICRRHGIELVG